MLITVTSVVLFFHEYRIHALFLAITQFKYFKTTHYKYNAASKKIMTFIAFNLNFRNLLKWIAFSWSKLFIFTNYTLVNIIKTPHLRGKCGGCSNSIICYSFQYNTKVEVKSDKSHDLLLSCVVLVICGFEILIPCDC